MKLTLEETGKAFHSFVAEFKNECSNSAELDLGMENMLDLT